MIKLDAHSKLSGTFFFVLQLGSTEILAKKECYPFPNLCIRAFTEPGFFDFEKISEFAWVDINLLLNLVKAI